MNEFFDFSKIQQVVFIGDSHGDMRSLVSNIVANTLYIHVGDIGFGFYKKNDEEKAWNKIGNALKKVDSKFIAIRGNHDDPKYFTGNYVNYPNVYLAPDYTFFDLLGKKYLLVGGAISIDRKWRTEGKSYWKDELFKLEEQKAVKADILVLHTAPSWAQPVNFSAIVYECALRDKWLLPELTAERKEVDKLVELVQPKLIVYGHMHFSADETINGIRAKLLNINELWPLPYAYTHK